MRGVSEARQNFRLTISYDGRDYLGWQRHGTEPTVQLALECGLEQVLGLRVEVRGSGRTDRGAHANGQVANVLLPVDLDVEKVRGALNGALPATVRVLDFSRVPLEFHARTAAVGKLYRYVIHNAKDCPAAEQGRVWHSAGALDVGAMRAVLPIFVGEHDFASFATKPNHKQKSTVREVHSFELSYDAPTIEFSIRADGFLYKMVRNIVRAVVKVGEGRYTSTDLQRILLARDRKAAPGTAPASGLYLEEVYYPQSALELSCDE